LLPEQFRITHAAALVLLDVLILRDPGRIDRTAGWLRLTTGVMIAYLTLATAVAAVRLVVGIRTVRRST
jgi:hypothetical protein